MPLTTRQAVTLCDLSYRAFNTSSRDYVANCIRNNALMQDYIAPVLQGQKAVEALVEHLGEQAVSRIPRLGDMLDKVAQHTGLYAAFARGVSRWATGVAHRPTFLGYHKSVLCGADCPKKRAAAAAPSSRPSSPFKTSGRATFPSGNISWNSQGVIEVKYLEVEWPDRNHDHGKLYVGYRLHGVPDAVYASRGHWFWADRTDYMTNSPQQFKAYSQRSRSNGMVCWNLKDLRRTMKDRWAMFNFNLTLYQNSPKQAIGSVQVNGHKLTAG